MSTTDNLALTLIETNQAQKEVTANTAIAALDAAICEATEVEIEDGSNAVSAATMRAAQMLVLIGADTSTPTAAFDVELAAVKRLLVVVNATDYDATVACSGAATGAEEAVVGSDGKALVYCDGTQVYLIASELTGVVEAFTDLSDVPSAYTSSGGKLLAVNSGATAVEFKPAREIPLEINAQTGTTYTLGLSDAGKLVTLDNGSAITLYVPDETSVDFPVGTQVLLAQLDAGQVTVAEGATAVTIITPETTMLRKAGAQAALVKIDSDTWLLEGNLEAA